MALPRAIIEATLSETKAERKVKAFEQIQSNARGFHRKDKCPVCGKKGCSIANSGAGVHCKNTSDAILGSTVNGSDGRTYTSRGFDRSGLMMWYVKTSHIKGHEYRPTAQQDYVAPQNITLARRDSQFRKWALLGGLTQEHRQGLRDRGLNDGQIQWCLDSGLLWSIDFGDNPRHTELPGKWDGKRSGYSGARGMAIACAQPVGNKGEMMVLGAQIQTNKSDREAFKTQKGGNLGKYIWMSSDSRPQTIGNKGFNGQGPITCHLTGKDSARHIVVTEGLLKPLVAFLRGESTHGIDLGAGVIGVAGSNWSTYKDQIFAQCKRLGVKSIHLAADAGTTRNRHVMLGVASFAELARQAGYDFKVIWYGQTTKPENGETAVEFLDIDEINQPVEHRLLSIDELINECGSNQIKKTAREAITVLNEETKNFKQADRTKGVALTTLIMDYLSVSSAGKGLALDGWIKGGIVSEDSLKSYGWRVVGNIPAFRADLHKRRLRYTPDTPYVITLGIKAPLLSKVIVNAFKALQVQIEIGLTPSEDTVNLAKMWRGQGVRTTRNGYGVNYWECIQKTPIKFPTETYNARYLAGTVDLEQSKLTAIKAAMGTGKTYLVKKAIQADKLGRTLFVVNSRSLATAAAEELGAMRHDQINWSEINDYKVVTICYDSLKDGGYVENFREFARGFKTVVFDEVESGLAHITTSQTLAHSRAEVQANWKMLCETKDVIIMDANLTQQTIDVFEETCNTICHTIVNSYSTGKGRKAYVYDERASLVESFYGAMSPTQAAGKRLYYCSDSRRPRSSRGIQATTTVAELCKINGVEHHLINQDTQSWSDHPDHGSMERLKDLKGSIVASPTISSGVSFDRGSNFDSVYASFSGVIDLPTCHQMLGRVRDDVPRHIFATSFGFAAMSSPDLGDEQREEEMMMTGLEEACEVNGIEGEAIKRRIKAEPNVLRKWRIDYQTRQARGAMDLRLNLARELTAKGYDVIYMREESRATQKFKDLAGEVAEELYETWKTEVVEAPFVPLKTLARLQTKTREQAMSETRALVYEWAVLENHPELLDEEMVELWDKHRRAVNRGGDLHVMAMLDDFAELDFSARDIHKFLSRKTVSIRDVRSMMAMREVIKKTGLLDKLSDLVGRHHNSEEQVKEVYEILIGHADIIRQATGVKIVETSQGKHCQQIAKLARSFGYKAERLGQSADENHKKQNYWLFSVDETVQGIWDRRMLKLMDEYRPPAPELLAS